MDYFVRNHYRRDPKPKKFKKNYEYKSKIENGWFYWREAIYKLMELLKKMHTRVKSQSPPHAFRYYQTMYQIAVV
jgi:hypothetical protein